MMRLGNRHTITYKALSGGAPSLSGIVFEKCVVDLLFPQHQEIQQFDTSLKSRKKMKNEDIT